MGLGRRTFGAAGAIALPAALVAAAQPSVLSQIHGGLWEFSGSRGAPTRLCIAHPPMLAQVEHSAARCTRTILRNDSTSAVIEYRCAGGGFGHSAITMLTPRSVQIETQGIADHAPFGYTVQARRVGNCPGH